MDEFVDIIGYENKYKINRKGQIWSEKSKKILNNKIDKGYYRIGLYKGKQRFFYLIHRLLAINFISNPNNLPLVDHIDGNPFNNNLENLRWASYELNNRNTKTVYNAQGSINIRRITKQGEYYQASYSITYKTMKSKSSYDRQELEEWLDEMKIKYPRNERI